MRQANVLKVAAIAIAAPRYAGAFAVAVGADPFGIAPWLLGVEVAGGFAMAMLEGLALAFVFGKWRLLTTKDRPVLTALLLALLVTVPLVSLPYLLAAQVGSYVVANIMPFAVRVLWSLTVLAVPPLIIGAVGFADQDEAEVARAQAEQTAGKLAAQALATPAPVRCETCGKVFAGEMALNGHKAHCRAVKPALNGRNKAQPDLNGKGKEVIAI